MDIQLMIEPLRGVSMFAASVEPIIKVILLILTVVLFSVAFLAYQKSKSQKMMLVAAFFGLFLLKYALATIDIFLSPGYFFPAASQNAVDFVALLVLFLALFRKQ